MKRRSFAYFIIPAIALSIWLGWLALVIYYQGGNMPWYGATSGSLEKAGQFGDAFGAIASLMATLAAAAALVAFNKQQEDSASQEFERNFLTLLNNFQMIISEIDVQMTDPIADPKKRFSPELRYKIGPVKAKIEGRDAARLLLLLLRESIGEPVRYKDSKTVYKFYSLFYNKWHDDLGHYFRTLYHIFKMIDDKCGGDKSHYARLVRAHLSSSELCLLAYNCSVGEGRHKFRNYIIEYSILHNLHRDGLSDLAQAELDFFLHNFPEQAFRFEEECALTYK